MSSHINIEGSLFIQDTEDGQTNNNIPFEIYSDYSANPTNTYFRQLQFSNVTSGSTYMGVSNVGSYFYISEPSRSPMSAQSDTFIITSAGNVGIGNTNPLVPLHVEGETKVSGSLNVVGDLITTNVYTSNLTFGNLVVGGNPNHKIPKGTIALWENSSLTTIPKGWTRFDAIGTSFVRGATSNIGETGGSNTVNIGIDNFPTHIHNTNNRTFSTGSHGHGISTVIGSSGNQSHDHSISSSVGAGGEHYHNTPDADPYEPGTAYTSKTGYWLPDNQNFRPVAYNTESSNETTSVHGHSHSFSFQNGKNLNINITSHSHQIVTPEDTFLEESGWTHITNGDTSSVGGNTNASIIPRYKSYVFIIKQ